MRKQPKVGDEVVVEFGDHGMNTTDVYRVVAYGRVSRVTEDYIKLEHWTSADPAYKPAMDCNEVEHAIIVWGAVTDWYKIKRIRAK